MIYIIWIQVHIHIFWFIITLSYDDGFTCCVSSNMFDIWYLLNLYYHYCYDIIIGIVIILLYVFHLI